LTCRKASASILAVDERQSLETLTREEKTASRSLAQLKEKHQDLDQKRAKLSEDARVQSERKAEVWFELVFASVGPGR
jgi:structural maintenance of chromosome 1